MIIRRAEFLQQAEVALTIVQKEAIEKQFAHSQPVGRASASRHGFVDCWGCVLRHRLKFLTTAAGRSLYIGSRRPI